MANFTAVKPRLAFFAAAIALIGTAPAFGQGGPRNISLEEVFQLVQTQNPSLRASVEGVEVTHQSTRQARSALLPQLSGEASQGRYRSQADKGSGILEADHGNNFSAGIVLSMAVIDANNIANYKAAKLEESAARYQLQGEVQDTLAQAARLYFLFIRNQSEIKVVQSSIALDEVLLHIAEERRKADVATELDLTRARATLARDRQALLVLQTQLDQTRHELLRLAGLDAELQIVPLAPELANPELAGLPGWMQVLETRPEYLAANELLERNRVAEKAADWQRFPGLAVQGRYGHASWLPGDGNGGKEWSIGMSMSVPIYDSGRIRSQKEMARAYIRQQEQRIREISDMVRSSYILAVQALRQRWEEIPLAQESVRLGELELKYARERFEANVTDNSDVVSAQLALASAQDSLVDAIYRYQLARVDLARVLGEVESRLGR